ncbi:MAG: thiamine pyrophosphate-dependent enzyme [SAR324 cluster bacterium]|nr:thiamine pyrophosphate-dependent enzyme [SAR324 cluster bacterium]
MEKRECEAVIDRLEASKYMVSKLKDELVVASLGNEKKDLAEAEDRDLNFYMWNSMGMASSMGLGLAMARPDTKVITLDGAGSLLMNLGSLATATVNNPPNLVHICWDNRMYQLTGEQPTATAFRTDLAKVAEGCGFASVARCETLDAFKAAFDNALAEPGPHFILALNDEKGSKGVIPKSPTYIRHRFMRALGLDS